tara:strand:+ start:73 stop:255 length:183 start_codon:yes stop_codon:yes gene_type:complete
MENWGTPMINYLHLSRANDYLFFNDYFPRQPTYIYGKYQKKLKIVGHFTRKIGKRIKIAI